MKTYQEILQQLIEDAYDLNDLDQDIPQTVHLDLSINTDDLTINDIRIYDNFDLIGE